MFRTPLRRDPLVVGWARTLEAESEATGVVLGAQLAVTRESVRRWRDEQLAGMSGDGAVPPDLEELLDGLDDPLTSAQR